MGKKQIGWRPQGHSRVKFGPKVESADPPEKGIRGKQHLLQMRGRADGQSLLSQGQESQGELSGRLSCISQGILNTKCSYK